ncbi:hypothetical protein CLOM_g7840 [Closterium sp. NIES-68]|nr:hypothetical protein CLOM_g17525 [Closterium sp. NIES-68]GJP48552.1 hypothetical protein CLOM_g7840 [Closterium sp. NIES-68]GJP86470.1 hypothetical protein CLOP_g16495 [Closterium sp. NIES-67]
MAHEALMGYAGGCGHGDESMSIAAIERSIEQEVQQIMAHKKVMADTTTGSGVSSSLDPPQWLPAHVASANVPRAHAALANVIAPAHVAQGPPPPQTSSAPFMAVCHGGGAMPPFYPTQPCDVAYHAVRFDNSNAVVWLPSAAQLHMHRASSTLPPTPPLAPNFLTPPPQSESPPSRRPLRHPPPVPQRLPPLSAGPSTDSAASSVGVVRYAPQFVAMPALPGSWLPDSQLDPRCDYEIGVSREDGTTGRPGVVMPRAATAPSATSEVTRGNGPCVEEGNPCSSQPAADDAQLVLDGCGMAEGTTDVAAHGGLAGAGDGDDISAWLSRLVGGTAGCAGAAGCGVPGAPKAEMAYQPRNEATHGHVLLTSAGVSSGTETSAACGNSHGDSMFGNTTHCGRASFRSIVSCNSHSAMPPSPAPVPAVMAPHPPLADHHPAPAPAGAYACGVRGSPGSWMACATVRECGEGAQTQRWEWGRGGAGGEESDEGVGVEEECIGGMTVEQILQERRKRRMVSNRLSAKRSRQRRQQLLSHLESDASKLKVEREQLRSKVIHATNRLTQLQEQQRKLEQERDVIKAEIETAKTKMNSQTEPCME